jgi:hypothetical protein
VYLLINLVEPSTNTRDYHVEVFDPTTGVAQVLPPVVLQNIGSAVAHTDLVFGDGSLWLYGYALGGKTEVVQISPVTGDVESMIGNPPQIGGIFPGVVADGAGCGSAAAQEVPHSSSGYMPVRAQPRTSLLCRVGEPAPSCGCRRQGDGCGPGSPNTPAHRVRRR